VRVLRVSIVKKLPLHRNKHEHLNALKAHIKVYTKSETNFHTQIKAFISRQDLQPHQNYHRLKKQSIQSSKLIKQINKSNFSKCIHLKRKPVKSSEATIEIKASAVKKFIVCVS